MPKAKKTLMERKKK